MKLIVATQDYAHTRALAGVSDLDDLDVEWRCDRPESIFSRALEQDSPFDVAEMSLATTWALSDQGDRRFVALPLFTSRMYRLSAFYTCSKSLTPRDLANGKIGVVRYGQTAVVWARAFLQDRYGIAPADMEWWIAERQSFEPDDIVLRDAGGVAELENMLETGGLDCLFATSVPRLFNRRRARRLFPDWPNDEQALYQETGVLPIMHTVLMRRSLAEAHPELAGKIIERFESAKRKATEWLQDTDATSLPMPLQHAWAEGMTRGGRLDPWPYGLESNRAVLESFAGHMAGQRLTSRLVSPEEVFWIQA